MKNSAAIAAAMAVILASSAAVAYVVVPANTNPDTRPQAGTIECRDAQIDRMRTMVVHIDTDPFERDYNRDNRNVAAVLDAAGELQKLCQP